MVIYLTTNLINGKKYIGLDTKNDPNYLGSGLLLSKSIKKYGKQNFKKEILEYCLSYEELHIKERYWINYLNACFSDEFYNIAEGGFGGNTLKGKTKEELIIRSNKLSAANKGKKWTSDHKLKISSSRKGIKFSDEQKHKISLAKKNHEMYSREEWKEKMKKRGEKQKNTPFPNAKVALINLKKKICIPIIQLDKDNNIINEWESAKQAANTLKYGQPNINKCVNNLGTMYKGYYWIKK